MGKAKEREDTPTKTAPSQIGQHATQKTTGASGSLLCRTPASQGKPNALDKTGRARNNTGSAESKNVSSWRSKHYSGIRILQLATDYRQIILIQTPMNWTLRSANKKKNRQALKHCK